MAQPSSPSPFFEILEIVKTEFEPKDAYVEEDTPTFIIPLTPNFKEKIESLRLKLKQRGFEVIIGQAETGVKLLVFTVEPTPVQSKRALSLNYPLILFIATVLSVTFSGYLTVSNYVNILKTLGEVRPGDEASFLWGQTALYTLAVMSIVGLHELGHTIACRINHVEASFPVFIPGIPGITLGTFGAVMRQKEPALNRDQLFEIGFSGPIVGFITALVVSYFGYSMSLPVSRAEYDLIRAAVGPSQVVYLPLIFMLLGPYLLPRSPNSFIYFLHPLALAGWMGTLITFLNIFPIGQLDGGHVARAVLGPRLHRKLSYIATFVMVLAGWWSMALLAILLIRFEHPGALDDVSPVSRNKKMLALLAVGIFFASLTLTPDSPLLFLIR